MVLGALNSTAFRYCLMLRILVVFSLMQSKTNSIWLLFSFINFDSHRPNISSVISGYKQPSKSAQSIEITGFIEKSKPPEIIFLYTLLPLTA